MRRIQLQGKSRELVYQTAVALTYLIVGLLTHHFVTSHGITSIVWLGSGLGLAAILIGGSRYIWGLLIGSSILNLISNDSLIVATGITAANVFEAQLGAWLITRTGRPSRFMGTLVDYLRLIALGGLASVLGAALGATALMLGGIAASAQWLDSVIHWWMGDSLGIVLITPLILAWARPRSTSLKTAQRLESIALVGITTLVAQIVFLNLFSDYLSETPKGYLMFLFIALVAIRLGVRALTVTVLLIGIEAFAGAALHMGFFANEIERADLHNYWAYMLILSITGMAFAAHNRALRLALNDLKLKDSALNAMANGVVITDVDGKIEWANRAVTKLSGYSLQEILGRNPRELVKSDKQDQAFYKDMWDTILSNKVWRGELVNRRKDGSLHDEELTITPLLNEQNEITHFVAVKLDISKRVLLDKEIAFSENLFRGLFENMSSSVAVYTPWNNGEDFVFKELNRSAEVLEGKSRNDLIGRKVTEVFPGVTECGLFAFFQEVYRTGLPQTCPVMYYQDNRLTGWRENRLYRLPTGEVVAIYEDVTERKRAEFAISESHQKISALLNSMAEGAYGVDTNGNCTFVNDSFLQILGYTSADDVIGKHIHELIHHSHVDGSLYPETECRMYAAYKQNRKIHCADEVFWRKDGVAIPVEYWSQPILTNGVMMGAIATFIDITERKLAEEKIRYSEQRFRDVSNAAGEYLWEIDNNMVYTYVSKRSFQVKGYSPEELLGHTPMEFMHSDDITGVGEIVNRAIADKAPFHLQHRDITKSEEIIWEEVSGTPFYDTQGNVIGLRGTGLNITDRKEREDQVNRLAFYDPLTRLPNRRLLNERLNHALINLKRTERCCALMFLDLDNFKPLNDKHGHVVGDLLLIEVANRLRSCVREVDTVARFGGDEFVVKLSSLNADKVEAASMALAIAEKIRSRLSEPYLLTVTNEDMTEAVVEHRSSASIGVTVFGKDATSQEDVLKQADIAMYQAKANGRNMIRFYDSNLGPCA
jgi:diguanylate cyclase (GGDEF)-like protein/PAS domain S-box-containing protein